MDKIVRTGGGGRGETPRSTGFETFAGRTTKLVLDFEPRFRYIWCILHYYYYYVYYYNVYVPLYCTDSGYECNVSRTT